MDLESRTIPAEILKSEKIYYGFARLVQWGMFFLAIVAFVASLVVATFSTELNVIPFMKTGITCTKIWAFVAALATGIIGLFNLPSKNRDVWTAWRMMNAAILRYKNDEEFTLKDLIDTYKKAEETIGILTINQK